MAGAETSSLAATYFWQEDAGNLSKQRGQGHPSLPENILGLSLGRNYNYQRSHLGSSYMLKNNWRELSLEALTPAMPNQLTAVRIDVDIQLN